MILPRCNLVGQDLNRAWADTNKFMHSEIVDIKKKLIYYDNHSKYDLGTVTPGPGHFPGKKSLNWEEFKVMGIHSNKIGH